MSEAASKSTPSRSSGRERRQFILEAALRLIARNGIRAVRHRAVAAEAEVPLAATTYYFQSIEDLLTETFKYWMEHKDTHFEEHTDRLASSLPAYLQAPPGSVERKQLAAVVRDATVEYILRQASARNDRIIELAFKHEALRSDALRQLVIDQDARYIDKVRGLMRAVGSSDPDNDAEITLSVVFRLEQQALINGVDEVRIHRVVTRHLQHLQYIPVE